MDERLTAAKAQYVAGGEREARSVGKSLVTRKTAMVQRNIASPDRTLYSLGRSSPRKTNCRGAAPAPKLFEKQ